MQWTETVMTVALRGCCYLWISFRRSLRRHWWTPPHCCPCSLLRWRSHHRWNRDTDPRYPCSIIHSETYFLENKDNKKWKGIGFKLKEWQRQISSLVRPSQSSFIGFNLKKRLNSMYEGFNLSIIEINLLCCDWWRRFNRHWLKGEDLRNGRRR